MGADPVFRPVALHSTIYTPCFYLNTFDLVCTPQEEVVSITCVLARTCFTAFFHVESCSLELFSAKGVVH